VRPNLFAMAPVVALVAWWWGRWSGRALIRALLFLAPVGLAAVVFAYVQQSLYGSASTTGYGEVSSLFSIDHVWPNLSRYPRWAIFTQSGLIVLAVAAPIAIRRGWVMPAIDRVIAERVAWSGLVFFGCLQAFYLLYIAFDDWVYFRFLLPALPWILVLQAAAIASACRRLPHVYHALAVILVAVLAASWGVGRARGLGAFQLQDSEQRYVDAADFVRGLPPNAVCLSLQHSGSLAYYTGAAVLRWDWTEPGEIDRAVSELSRKGHLVFAVLDDWEVVQFRERFAGTTTVSRLGRPVFAAGSPEGIKAQIYSLSDALNGAPAIAAAEPVSSPLRLALQNPRTPGAPGPASESASGRQ
jgi:hypothetical protein